MNDILYSLAEIKIDEEFIFLILILVSTILVFVAVSFIFIGAKSATQKKLEEIKSEASGMKLSKAHKIDNTLESLAPIIAPRNIKERETARHKLMHAGFHEANALTIFYAIKLCSFIIGAMVAAGLYFFQPEMSNLLFAMVISIAIGMFIPNFVLNRFVNQRQSKIKGGIPDALDLLVVCTESGLGFNAALRRVADELVISHPDFADELDTVCVKIKAGVEMQDAFAELVKRTGVTEITGLVNMLAHASRVGGSIAQTLREYTEDFRDKRNQEVEEIAAKIPTKMIFPLLLFIWPCFFIVAIGPSMLSITSTLGQ
ncbi:type II secretion system F family protein [Vibrio sp. S4M6]|uniref:type II secretion system F family protein n=1 Tax=Vibrio sinus TaxID=2946865 RepID=UPI00202A8E9A|nr:type II secretion system F family protein [Vibrio sinus]MCL9781423.1 type II secretion system F family protein [Vibrio sinus]